MRSSTLEGGSTGGGALSTFRSCGVTQAPILCTARCAATLSVSALCAEIALLLLESYDHMLLC